KSLIRRLVLATLELDAGAIFGQRGAQAAPGRVRLPVCSYLIDGRILVDAGPGGWTPASNRPELRWEPLDVEAVELVVFTHLHFDHVGGAVAPDGSPVFPRARCVAQQAELDYVRAHPDRCPVPLQGLDWHPVQGVAELEGLRLELTGGHTPGHQAVWLGSTLFPGDECPTRRHRDEDLVLSFDCDPDRVREVRRSLFSRADRVMFSHDHAGDVEH
ncbi:MAG: MBL fold metallo-hydrolase, partial [Candidatus Eremiobacterota bacterium]